MPNRKTSASPSAGWPELSREFEEAAKIISKITIEDREQAIARIKSRRTLNSRVSLDPDHISYQGNQFKDYTFFLEVALLLIPEIRSAIANKNLASTFLKDWGWFNFAYGILTAGTYSRGQSDPELFELEKQRLNTRKSQVLNNRRRRFVAALLDHNLHTMTLQNAQGAAAEEISRRARTCSDVSLKEWYLDLIKEAPSEKGARTSVILKSTFVNKFSVEAIREEARAARGDNWVYDILSGRTSSKANPDAPTHKRGKRAIRRKDESMPWWSAPES